MEAGGKIPTGIVPAGRSAVGIMLVDRSRRPSSEAERRQLSSAVTDRGWSLSVRFGAAAALAELCVVDREEATREAWGLPRRFDLVLLIAGGIGGEELDVLVRAVRAHAPRTRIHRWTGAMIVPIDDGDRPDGGTGDREVPRETSTPEASAGSPAPPSDRPPFPGHHHGPRTGPEPTSTSAPAMSGAVAVGVTAVAMTAEGDHGATAPCDGPDVPVPLALPGQGLRPEVPPVAGAGLATASSGIGIGTHPLGRVMGQASAGMPDSGIHGMTEGARS